MIGQVYLPKANKEDTTLLDANLACEKLAHLDEKIEDFYATTPILIVDRGECPFVVKVRNAEDIGI
jgi:hypothetical protein